MSDQITKILIRKGTESEKNAIVLSEAELGFTTDQKRLWLGDGVTIGGVNAANKYLGSFSSPSAVTNQVIGDIIYNQNNTQFQILTGTNSDGNIGDEQYVNISSNEGTVTRIDAGTGLIFNTSDSFITTTGTININVDNTKRNAVTNSSNGILGDFDVIYPVGSVKLTQTNVNPSSSGGVLEGAGQTWLAAGELTTTTSVVLYAWIRTG